MSKRYSLKSFVTTIDTITYVFNCWTTDVPDGFIEHCENSRMKYYNRSWQRFEYETVLRNYINKIYGNNKKLCEQLKENLNVEG